MGKRNKKKKKWKNQNKYTLLESSATSEQVHLVAYKVFGSLYYNSSSDLNK